MISIRSAISRSVIAGRRPSNAAAAFLQANVPFPPPSSSDRNDDNTASASVRHLSSPAYRRHKLKSLSGHRAFKPTIGAHQHGIQTPTLEVARDMGKTMSEMENEPLVVIAEIGNHRARTEVLRRHIMATDFIDYNEACKMEEKIAVENRQGASMFLLSYKCGIAVAMVLGIGAFPMVFHEGVAMAFNTDMVTMDIPPPDELDTMLETGIWTWNWMEPMLGTASFALLCLQFARQQILNLGLKTTTERLIARRSKRLYESYPQYEKHILHNYVETSPLKQ